MPQEGGRAKVWHQNFDASGHAAHFHSFVLPVPEDLTPEEQQELENIRRRKQELLEDIQVTLVWKLERSCRMQKKKNVCKYFIVLLTKFFH